MKCIFLSDLNKKEERKKIEPQFHFIIFFQRDEDSLHLQIALL